MPLFHKVCSYNEKSPEPPLIKNIHILYSYIIILTDHDYEYIELKHD